MRTGENIVVARGYSDQDERASTSWPSWIVSGLIIAFLITDAIPKIFRASFSVDSTIDLGYPDSIVVWLGIVLLVSTALYTIPRTAAIGAILLTGYLGGAIATQARIEEWALILMPAAMAALTWVGLILRDPRIGRIFRG